MGQGLLNCFFRFFSSARRREEETRAIGI